MELLKSGKDGWIFCEPSITIEIEMQFDHAVQLWKAKQTTLAETLFHRIISQCPNHIDAIHHLAIMYEEIGRSIDSYLCCRAAVCIGLQAIPDKFSWKKSKIDWIFLDNRPLLRAYHYLGLKHLNEKQYSSAIQIFERLLAVNPNDNQGCRYLLPSCWFATNEIEKVISLCQSNHDDISPEIIYSNALALVIIGHDAREAMTSAVEKLPLVAKELLKKRHPRKSNPSEGIIHGQIEEAVSYCFEFKKYWLKSKLAMKLLSEIYNS